MKNMKMNRKKVQLILVFVCFVSVAALATGVIPLAVIQGDRTIAGSQVTVSDLLTLIGVFGSITAIMIWVTQYRRGK